MMDTLNLNMKAPTGVFRKFHGKELDLKEQHISIRRCLSHDFLCVSTATASQPAKSPRHSLASYPPLMTLMSCTFHVAPQSFSEVFPLHTLITAKFLFVCINKAHAIFITTSEKRSLTVAEEQGSTTIWAVQKGYRSSKHTFGRIKDVWYYPWWNTKGQKS